MGYVDHYKVCPICEKEDLKYYHRRIIRVQHQINGVRVCWKHSCALAGEKVQDPDAELAIAKFATDLFSNPPDCTLEAFGDTVTADVIAGAVSDQYLTAEEGKRLLGAVQRPKIRFADGLIRFLAWFYAGDAGKFLQTVPLKKESAGSSLFERIRGEYGVGEYRCGKCGTVFHMSDKAVEAGTVCPRCRNGLTEEEQIGKILARYADGKYEYRNGKLIHTVCGSESRAKDMFWLHDACECKRCKNNWAQVFAGTGFDVVGVSEPNEKTSKRVLRLRHRCGCEVEVPGYTKYKRVNVVSCPNCDGVKAFVKRMREMRLGERRVGVNGIGCEIVGYDGTEQVKVRFDNGLERTMAYQVFDGIGKGKMDKFPELRIGLTNTMGDGMVGRITKYEGKERVGVEFEDGTFVWTDMKRFWRGTVAIGSAV